MAKTCDKCEHWTPPDEYEKDDRPNNGACALMSDANADRVGDATRCRGWDYEGYCAGVYVAPKFGCIHWQAKRT